MLAKDAILTTFSSFWVADIYLKSKFDTPKYKMQDSPSVVFYYK